jgi:hypothetical protein
MTEEEKQKIARFSLSFGEFCERVKQFDKTPTEVSTTETDELAENDSDEVFTAKTDEELAEEDNIAHEVFHKVQMENITMALAQKCQNFGQFHEYMKRLEQGETNV